MKFGIRDIATVNLIDNKTEKIVFSSIGIVAELMNNSRIQVIMEKAIQEAMNKKIEEMLSSFATVTTYADVPVCTTSTINMEEINKSIEIVSRSLNMNYDASIREIEENMEVNYVEIGDMENWTIKNVAQIGEP